jgi:hypothetical protein
MPISGEDGVCTLDGQFLPRQFRYKPVSPQKRVNLLQTSGGTVIRYSPYIVAEDSLMPWTIEAGCVEDWILMFDLFNQPGHPDMEFLGYWGDDFFVKFHTLDQPDVEGRLFNISGSFQVVSVTNWHG